MVFAWTAAFAIYICFAIILGFLGLVVIQHYVPEGWPRIGCTLFIAILGLIVALLF